MNRLRPVAILAAFVLAGGLFAGCARPNQTLDPAANAVADAKVDAKADLQQAVLKLATTTSTLSLQVTGTPVAASLTGSLDPKGRQAAITVTAAGQAIEFRALTDALYVKLGDLGSLVGLPSSGWVKLDKSRIMGSLGNTLKPDQALGAAASISAAITVTSTGNGEYQGSLDASKLSGALGAAKENANTTTVPFTATVNADGYLTRLIITAKQITATLNFSDFGKPVDIKAPPANQVTNAPEAVYDALSHLGK